MAHSKRSTSANINLNKKRTTLGGVIGSKWKKYPLGGDVNKEEVFDFPYIVDEESISFIQKHGRIMFIIRGPPGTGKATLSDMILKQYSDAAYCCADQYFLTSFSPERNRKSLKESHEQCEKKAEAACFKHLSPIVVQNTHIRKWEMQPYLDLAAVYNYTVIMAVTLYKFDVTLEALEKNNTDGLSLEYFQGRMRKWVDVMPNFTGWFLCPKDSHYLLHLVQEVLEALLDDGKFCSVFDAYDLDTVFTRFKARRLLFCLAKYSKFLWEMKNYYLSDTVQECYGKCFKIIVKGYLISPSGIIAIVDITKDMEPLIVKNDEDGLSMNPLQINNNICEYSKLTPFDKAPATAETVDLEDWVDREDFNLDNCNFIDIAQNNHIFYDFQKLQQELTNAAVLMKAEETTILELENGMVSYRLPNNEWLLKAPKKIIVKSVFTGLYT